MKLLVRFGAKLDAREKKSLRSALHLAAAGGHAGVALVLVEAKADIHAKDKFSLSALHLAAAAGGPAADAIMRVLVEAKADIHAEDQKMWNSLDMAADKDKKGSHEACIAVLREHGAKHSLKYAASGGLAEEVAACIADGQNLDACGEVIKFLV